MGSKPTKFTHKTNRLEIKTKHDSKSGLINQVNVWFVGSQSHLGPFTFKYLNVNFSDKSKFMIYKQIKPTIDIRLTRAPCLFSCEYLVFFVEAKTYLFLNGDPNPSYLLCSEIIQNEKHFSDHSRLERITE